MGALGVADHLGRKPRRVVQAHDRHRPAAECHVAQGLVPGHLEQLGG
jgi:hypothetical protein